ncbi:hypothetical protein GGQ26_08215 [Aeromicrobium sp. zg-629]|uniref:hypothetical protein n=1 Tax=Aeromicrobium senzhongii TaxID=2663859 RepID=UPI0012B6636D|nr:hypothetical protein [Aeromicrobium senzhongii]MTB88334.1 hypothetical protein [Aeromicrobium senzhongii]
MADPAKSQDVGQPSQGPGTRTGAEIWVRRIVVVLALVVIALVIYGVLAAALPRWWSRRVADQVDGRMTVGVFWGLFYGFVFSFLPVLVAWQARRPFLKWPWKIAVVVLGVALAAPNWLTLSISLGQNSASDAGWIKLVNDAPGFQWATLFGAVAGVLAALALIVLMFESGRRKRQVSKLRNELAERDAPPAGTAESNDLHREDPPHA